MKKVFCIIVMLTLNAASQDNRPLFLAHFMPWHQTPDISGYWGWHWTMNHFNPENMDENGRRDIASHYYPLTGPYDSKDVDILEYQTLLMKIAGIDGVLVDWYGMEDFWDYGVLNAATAATFDAVEKAGLSFAIVYEDQSIKHMIDHEHLAADQDIAHGKKVMQFLEENWFNSQTYQKTNHQPLLLVFGPQYFKSTSNWSELFSVLNTPPMFFTEDNRIRPAVGAYPWPPMWKSNSDGILTTEALGEYWDNFYTKANAWDYLLSGAFPQFHDIYKEAGAGAGYGRLESHDGETLRSTLQRAISEDSDIIQLITWNDYGEGTMIEPTEEFGYQFIEIVQDARRSVDAIFPFLKKDLQIPFGILKLRQDNPNDAPLNAELDAAFDYIVADQPDSAKLILTPLGVGVHSKPTPALPANYRLQQNYPNPFNPTTTITYTLSKPAEAIVSVYDAGGRIVDILYTGKQSAGTHTTIFKAANLASGIYFYDLRMDGKRVDVKKMLLVR